MRNAILIAAALCTFMTGPRAEGAGLTFGTPEIVANGFKMSEGPVWDAASATPIFPDIPGNTIFAFDPASGETQVWRNPSDNANGLALDSEGHLLAAEQRTCIIKRIDPETRAAEPFIRASKSAGHPVG